MNFLYHPTGLFFNFLIVYVVLVTLAQGLIYYRSRKTSSLEKLYEKMMRIAEKDSMQDIEKLAKIAEICSKRIPWYQKTLSAVGMLALGSAAFATLFQMVQLEVFKAESLLIRNELQESKEILNKTELTVRRLVQNILYSNEKKQTMTQEDKKILNYYRQLLEDKHTINDNDRRLLYDILLATEEYAVFLERYSRDRVYDTEIPTNKIDLANAALHALLNEDIASARHIFKDFDKNYSSLPNNVRRKVVFIQYMLGEKEDAIRRYNGIYHLTDEAAKKILENQEREYISSYRRLLTGKRN